MGKGDHSRNWAYKLPPVDYAKRVDSLMCEMHPIGGMHQTDSDGRCIYCEGGKLARDDQPARVCMTCKALKPEGKWCFGCDRETDSERVYVENASEAAVGENANRPPYGEP